MNLIETKFNIDIDNEQQLEAYNAFIKALKGTNGVAPTVTAPVKDIKSNITQPSTSNATTATATTQATTAPAASTTGSKKLDAIRALITAKVGNNRESIKAKLGEWGFASATELTVDKYDEFHKFLDELPVA